MSAAAFTDSKFVFIVEAQFIYRIGLREFLNERANLKITGESGSARGCAGQVATTAPHLVITELSLPDGSGLELIKELRSTGFDGGILVLSSHDESLYAERALRVGANGYVMKSQNPDRILEAIEAVLRGDVFISEQMNARLLRRMSGASAADPERGALDRLTDREIQVLELIGSGLMTREIAERLAISSKTVDTHRINIRQKLGIPDVNELIRFAVHWLGSGALEKSL